MESGGETEVERREVEEEESARNQTQAAWWHRVGFLRFVVGEPFDEGILLGLDLLQRLVLLVESLQLRKLLVYLRLQRLLLIFSILNLRLHRIPLPDRLQLLKLYFLRLRVQDLHEDVHVVAEELDF